MRGAGAWRLLCLVILLLTAPAPSSAQGAAAVREMMEASGLVEEFANFGEAFRLGVLQEGEAEPALPRDELEQFAAAAGRAMDGGRILQEIERALSDTLSAGEIAAMTEFYRTPLGERIRSAEVAAARELPSAEIKAEEAEHREQLRKDPARLALLRRMDEALLASELTVSMSESMMLAILVGMLEREREGAGQEAFDAFRDSIAPTRKALLTEMREDLLASSARTYRDISTPDLAAYARFLETDEARANYAAYFAAMEQIFNARGREIGKEFGTQLRQKKA